MPRRKNELFVGSDHLNDEGRSIKHPALISYYANINPNKTSNYAINLIGYDCETNHKTGELRLMGFYDEDEQGNPAYDFQTDNFMGMLAMKINSCIRTGREIAFWNQLDPFVIFKEFLKYTDPYQARKCLERYGKIGGDYNKKTGKWDVPPVVEIEWGTAYYGIQMVLNGAVQFFRRTFDGGFIWHVWGYDISTLYEQGIEAECKGRLPWYRKGEEELHLIDWDRFAADADYKRRVLESNMLDARAVRALGHIIQEEFKTAFGYYPRSLVSQGSLARSAIVATLVGKYKKSLGFEDTEMKSLPAPVTEAVLDDLKSIGFINHYDQYAMQLGDALKDFYCLTMEAYSGGYIESLRYGFCKEAWYCDIASAYPSVIRTLYDLRGSKITTGKGEPPHIPNSYCFIRGMVDIPADCDFHPITVKNPIAQETNIRAVGQYIAAYTLAERDFLVEQGARFTAETWYNVETTGKLSPMAEVCDHFLDLRAKLKAAGNSAQYMAKIAANSLYGIQFEAVDTFEEKQLEFTETVKENHPYKKILTPYLKRLSFDGIENELKATFQDEYKKIAQRWKAPAKASGMPIESAAAELAASGLQLEETHPAEILRALNHFYTEKVSGTITGTRPEIIRAGYRAGEFFNPIYASIITSGARILISKALQSIRKAGGKPILVMTDSIFWEGKKSDIPADLWRAKKTVGYFEEPARVENMVCLGAGRYEYESGDHVITAKRRGLNAVDLHDPQGIPMDAFNWRSALDVMARTGSEKIHVKVRALLSVGIILHNHDYKIEDLGRVVEDVREVDCIVGKSKRIFDSSYKNPAMLMHSMVETYPIILAKGMLGDKQFYDQTLPKLRALMDDKKVVSFKEQTKKRKCENQKAYAKRPKTKEKLSNDYKTKYAQIRDMGYLVDEAKKMAKWSMERLMAQFERDGKI